MNDDQIVEAYTGGGAGLPGLRAVELAAAADLTAQLQTAQATIAEQAEHFLASLDRLYFSGGYRTVNRGMVERAIRAANPSTTPKETR